MAEWDELDARLKGLGQATTERVNEPLPAADVRALGVRRHHRRQVGMVAVAAVLMLLGGVGVYSLGAQPMQREPSPAAPVTATSTPTPTESTPSEALGHGKLIKKKPRPTERARSYPTYWPTYAPSTPAPSASETRESPEPSPTDTEPSETSQPEPTETDAPAPEQTEAPEPTTKPTGGGNEEPVPVPTDGSSGQK